ncbi:MAG TPA: transglycosylase domain-containing protein [Candidatus Limnocylindrales bacterium]
MQTSLARRQRHRRALQRRPQGRTGTTIGRVLLALLVVLIAAGGLLAGSGAVVAMGAYNYYAQGLPDPVEALTNIPFEQQTVIYDRTGKIELARLGDLKRELVTFEQIPGEMLDATTAIEDKDFWVNAGFDPAGMVSAGLDTVAGKPRGASTITQQLVRARLLPPEAFEGTTYERKAREIIQSIRLTQAYPGEAGKQAIITAYLNQNFYGNQSYGVKAAAKGYFGKSLDQLTLAQHAILAAIPQSPSKFDLVRNAEEVCLETGLAEGEECTKFKLVVPQDSEIVQRRNKVLELMETRSPMTGDKHSLAEYEAAKNEPVELQPQVSAQWKAPHFVWQVRRALGAMYCPDTPNDCTEVDTKGLKVISTIDLKMQKATEKWVYVAARAPNAKDPSSLLASRKIPRSARNWIMGLRGHNINNAAAAVEDYRTGEILAYAGSASYTSKKSKRFQPKFDVLADGWRQPGSAIKPINYAIGVDDKTLTAATMIMDVTTNFGGNFIPTQADKLERGPVRLRSALQFSLNIPAIKATIMSGLDHVYERSHEFGLTFPSTALPVLSMGIGTLEVHPIDLLGAYSTLANGGVLMPRRVISTILDTNGQQVWPTPENTPKGTRVISAGAAYIMTDIMAGNTDKKVNPFWGKWAIYENGKRRPAAYKTGTTSDNRDVAAYGYVAPPADKQAPALAVGVWMGNSDNSPNDGKLSLDTSAPLWSAILTEVSKGTKIAQFKRPAEGLVTAKVDAYTGLRPGPFSTRTVTEYFLPGTVPSRKETVRIAVTVDSKTGLKWRDGCAGPKVTRGYFNLSEVESNYPNWQKANANWGARAARGSGVGGGPKGTRTAYFYNGAFAPFGRTWGARFAPTKLCPLYTPPPAVCDPFASPDPGQPVVICPPGGPFRTPDPDQTQRPKPTKRP